MVTASNKIYISEQYAGTEKTTSHVECYQLQEISCVKSGWILSVAESMLCQERLNIVSCRKSVVSRACGYLSHLILQNTLVYS